MIHRYHYEVLVDGVASASFRTFGDANHAAFDDLPWWNPLGDKARVVTVVRTSEGRQLAAYMISAGRRAYPLDVLCSKSTEVSQ